MVARAAAVRPVLAAQPPRAGSPQQRIPVVPVVPVLVALVLQLRIIPGTKLAPVAVAVVLSTPVTPVGPVLKVAIRPPSPVALVALRTSLVVALLLLLFWGMPVVAVAAAEVTGKWAATAVHPVPVVAAVAQDQQVLLVVLVLPGTPWSSGFRYGKPNHGRLAGG